MSSDILELYRWPDGYTMVRPITPHGAYLVEPKGLQESGTLSSEISEYTVIFALLDPTGKPLNIWWYFEEKPIIEQEVRLYDEPEGAQARWRAFFFDMLVPINTVLAGGLRMGAYRSLHVLPMTVSEAMVDSLSDELERVSLVYSEHVTTLNDFMSTNDEGLALQGQMLAAIPSSWKMLSKVETDFTRGSASWEISPSLGFSIHLNRFYSPGVWNLDDPDLKQEWNAEWIVADGQDYILSAAHTPRQALSKVKQLVWPDSVATNERLNLEAWLDKWVTPGKPMVDISLFKMLQVPSPISGPHSAFVAWARSLDV